MAEADDDRNAVVRALLDCPVHAITEWGEHRETEPHDRSIGADDPAEGLKTEANEAEWGFTR